jgi:hypothetical protein
MRNAEVPARFPLIAAEFPLIDAKTPEKAAFAPSNDPVQRPQVIVISQVPRQIPLRDLTAEFKC